MMNNEGKNMKKYRYLNANPLDLEESSQVFLDVANNQHSLDGGWLKRIGRFENIRHYL